MKFSHYLMSFLAFCLACGQRPLVLGVDSKIPPNTQSTSDISKDPGEKEVSNSPLPVEKDENDQGSNSGTLPSGQVITPDPIQEPMPQPEPYKFKALTFNVYTASAAEIARSVKNVNPEIACLQEASVDETKEAAKILGEGWVAVVPPDGSEYSFVARLPLVKSLGNTKVKRGVVGAVFRLGDVEAAFFCHHGHYPQFGARDYLVKKISADEAIKNEKNNRESQMKEVLSFVDPYKKKNMPVFIMGDFNTASHTDYINPSIAWPITMMIQSSGYGDSWRDLHQDLPRKAIGQYLKTDPGITWYRLKREPQDLYTRMDYIFYAGPIKPIESKTVDLAPSDHFSLYTIFQLK